MNNDSHARVVAELLARQPEHQIGPSLERIQLLVDLLGDPHRGAPVVQITGTNGKGSTAIMVDALLRAQGLRTGRYGSPHLVDVTERICVDGRPVSAEVFDAAWEQIKPFVEIVDARRIDGIAMTFFEVLTGLAFAVFADAPVDVAVLEVGMGGAWDATNVADATVAIVTPIAVDHTEYLGSTPAEIAVEKSGIIKAGSVAVLAGQEADVARILVERAASVGARVVAEGIDFSLLDRAPGVGGQVLRLDCAGGTVEDVVLPLYGVHMAHNAALALAAVSALHGDRPIEAEVVTAGFADVVAPARLERVRTSPPVVLDTAHNPAAVEATVKAAVESFAFAPLVVVLGIMRDKDVAGVLGALVDETDHLVATQPYGPRALPAAELGELAQGVLGEDRVIVRADVSDAIEAAVTIADESGPSAGVLLLGSVALAGQARALLVTEREEAPAAAPTVSVGDDDWDVPESLDVTRFGGRDWGSEG
jgi:dihydrofolate synthase / folylpolyglutamate synthase